jgi:hypothetical protein
MGQLEYHAMPSLPDVVYDGWLYIYIYYITAAGNSISSAAPVSSVQPVRYGKGR